ncbi:glycosyltransferase [Lacipirellula sp.]|uniref:glycosyltransferase n=1 Tax=Lacipirellula sp. TaxID=2691419 RepID=UPI003D1223B6
MPFSCVHFIREIRSELGGVVTAVLDLSQAMATRGHRVSIVTCDAQDVPQEWRGAGNWPTVIEVPHSRISRQFLSRAARASFGALLPTADVVHLHTPWELANFQLAPLIKRSRTPYVVTPHGMLDHYSMSKKAAKKHAFLALGGRSLFRTATTVHFTAQAEMDQALKYVPVTGNTAVISCLLDLSAYSELPGPEPALRAFPQIQADKFKILFLSRVHPKKGVDLLIQAVAELRRRGRQAVQALIAGPGDEAYVAELKRLAASLGVQDAVEFLGMVRGVEKRSLYQAADVFVLPTHQENFGLVLAEAMACGTPVVTTRGADIWQELQTGGAEIVDAAPASIADGIERFAADLPRSREIGLQGRAFVNEWLDRDRVAAAYEAMYQEAIER